MLGTHLSGRSARGQIRLTEPGVARRWAWRPTAGGFPDAEKPCSKGLGSRKTLFERARLHIVLSRELCDRNHWPAIDVLPSLSRVMNAVVDERHRQAAGRVRELMAAYEQKRDLIACGAYKPGSDARTDEAIAAMDAINAFLRQGTAKCPLFGLCSIAPRWPNWFPGSRAQWRRSGTSLRGGASACPGLSR